MKAVVFDMDGVIFDSEKLVIECWIPVAEKYGIPNIVDACHECLGINSTLTREKMHARYGEDFPYDTYKAEMSALFHERAKDGKLPKKPGIFEILDYLKEKNVKIAVASSTRREVVVRQLTEGGLIEYFDKVICGDMVSKSKPDPEIFLKACEELGVAPEEAFGIEDSYNGIRSCKAANMHPIMVPDLAPVTDEMTSLAEHIMDSIMDVKTFFEKENVFE